MRNSVVYSCLGLGLLVGAVPGIAQAQEADESRSGLEEIVVTAQRRAESLQDVPIAVAAFGGEALERSGVTDTTSLNGQIPSLTMSTRGPQNVIFIRGIGSNGSGVTSEQSVATYVDGVYIYSSVGNQFPLNNVKRIEVLKGPQGTLFGRNATGGVINIVTGDPEHDAQVKMKIGYANYNTVSGDFYGTTGLGSNLALDLAITYKDQNEGWGRNLTRHEDTYRGSDLSIRSKLLWEPSDRTKVRLIGAYTYQKTAGYNEIIAQGEAGVDGVVRYTKPYDIVSDFRDGFHAKSYMGSLQIEQDFDFARLISITAYRRVDATYISDQDATPFPLVEAPYVTEPSRNWQQEIRLEGTNTGPFQWMVGGFFFKAKAGFVPLRLQGLIDDIIVNTSFQNFPKGAVVALDEFGTQKITSKSLFGQASYELGTGTKLTGGLRYTWEKVTRVNARNVAYYAVPGTTGPDGTSDNSPIGSTFTENLPFQRDTNRKLTFRFAVDQTITDNVLAYGSFSRGYKTGGYNLVGVGAIPAFEPEQLDAYEIGLKTELFDRRIRFNLAAFKYKYKDIQVQLTVAGGENTANAAAARMKGVDMDFQALVTENFTIRGSLGYLDGHYKQVIDPATGQPFVLPGYPGSAVGGFSYDPAGKRTVYSPKWSGNIGGTYTIPSKVGEFVVDANLVFTNSSYVQPTNRLTLPSYKVLNTSISWTSLDEKFGIRLWANNLTDDRYLASGLESGLGDILVYAPPRTYGVTLSATM